MPTQDIAPTIFGYTDEISPDLRGTGHQQGVVIVSGEKGSVSRALYYYDLSTRAGEPTAAELRLNVTFVVGKSGFASLVMRVLESFTTDFSWNKKNSSTNWATPGPSEPDSATLTDYVSFTSPTATGAQAIVSDVLTLTQDAIDHRSDVLLLVLKSSYEDEGEDAYYLGNTPILRITYTSTANIKKVSGVALASIKKVAGVAIASVKKVSGVTN